MLLIWGRTESLTHMISVSHSQLFPLSKSAQVHVSDWVLLNSATATKSQHPPTSAPGVLLCLHFNKAFKQIPLPICIVENTSVLENSSV